MALLKNLTELANSFETQKEVDTFFGVIHLLKEFLVTDRLRNMEKIYCKENESTDDLWCGEQDYRGDVLESLHRLEDMEGIVWEAMKKDIDESFLIENKK